MARIYKQRDKWCFSIELGTDEHGNRKRAVRGGFLREKDAKKAARDFENTLDSGKISMKPCNITLHDFMWDVWFKYHSNFIKISSQVVIKGSLQRIDYYFSSKVKLKDITADMCTAFINQLFYKNKLSKSTIRSTLSCLKMIFKHALIVEHILLYNPAEYVFLPKMYIKEKERLAFENSKEKLYLEKNEIKTFLKLVRQAKNAFPFVTFFTVLIYTGMRAGEALSLQWDNIDFDKRIIHVRSTIYFRTGNRFDVYSPKTLSSIRDIIISDTLVNELKRYRKQFLEYKLQNKWRWLDNDYNFVFVSQQQPGNPIRFFTVSSCTRRLGQKMRIKSLHPHMFRHTHVSILAAEKVPLSAIKERLGHSTDKTTERIYMHITKQFKAETAASFEHAMQCL